MTVVLKGDRQEGCDLRDLGALIRSLHLFGRYRDWVMSKNASVVIRKPRLIPVTQKSILLNAHRLSGDDLPLLDAHTRQS